MGLGEADIVSSVFLSRQMGRVGPSAEAPFQEHRDALIFRCRNVISVVARLLTIDFSERPQRRWIV